MSVLQSTQFEIKKLAITSTDGSQGYDVRAIFEELNLFDSMLMPCMSGNIVIRDAIGLASSINFDGSECLEVDIVKDSDNPNMMFFRKRYVIYKLTDRKELNQKSEIYTLHFVSEEFILSEQKKIRQTYRGTYFDMVVKILDDHLHVPFETIFDGKSAGIANMEPTMGNHVYSVPNVSPMKAIEYITKRAISTNGTPDYLFWENQVGYNFMSLSTSMSFDPFARITYGVKNITDVMGDDNEISYEVYGARDIKVLSQFNMAKNVQDGVYAGKFIGFDPLTRTVSTQEYSFDSVYEKGNHANDKPFNYMIYNKEKKSANEMYDARIALYPFQEERRTSNFLKEKDTKTTNIIDDSHNYVLQRQVIFTNLMQRRLRLVLPGNFAIASGNNYEVEIPHRFVSEDKQIDSTLSGKYITLSVRHMIRYDKHETIIEVATDSMKKV
jgi:hypothetical protein